MDQRHRKKSRRELFDHKAREATKLPTLVFGERDSLHPLAKVKFFMPDGVWTWYASAFDDTDMFFGLVEGNALELGYFSLRQLEVIRGPRGLCIERDRYFTPVLLTDLVEKLHTAHGWSKSGN